MNRRPFWVGRGPNIKKRKTSVYSDVGLACEHGFRGACSVVRNQFRALVPLPVTESNGHPNGDRSKPDRCGARSEEQRVIPFGSRWIPRANSFDRPHQPRGSPGTVRRNSSDRAPAEWRGDHFKGGANRGAHSEQPGRVHRHARDHHGRYQTSDLDRCRWGSRNRRGRRHSCSPSRRLRFGSSSSCDGTATTPENACYEREGSTSIHSQASRI